MATTQSVSEMMEELGKLIDKENPYITDGDGGYAYRAGWLYSFASGMASSSDPKAFLKERIEQMKK